MSKSSQPTPLERCKAASQTFPGAPISRVQLDRVESALSRPQKALATKHRTAIRTYAKSGDRTSLPPAARDLLRDVNAMYDKAWARKSAAIVGFALVPPRKRAAQRSQEPQPEGASS